MWWLRPSAQRRSAHLTFSAKHIELAGLLVGEDTCDCELSSLQPVGGQIIGRVAFPVYTSNHSKRQLLNSLEAAMLICN